MALKSWTLCQCLIYFNLFLFFQNTNGIQDVLSSTDTVTFINGREDHERLLLWMDDFIEAVSCSSLSLFSDRVSSRQKML